MNNNHPGHGHLFSEFLVTVHPWVCPDVQAPVAKHQCVHHVHPVLSPTSSPQASGGAGHSTRPEGHLPRTRGTFRLSSTSQCVLLLLGEAETSRSRWERQQQTPALTSCPGQRKPPALWIPHRLSLPGWRGAGPRTAQSPKHQLASGLPPQDHCNDRPLPETDRQTGRQTDRQTRRKGQALVSTCLAPEHRNLRSESS